MSRERRSHQATKIWPYIQNRIGLVTPGGSGTGTTHEAVTLTPAADTVLDLSGQAVDLDLQAANTVLAGPAAGAATAPAFRLLTSADIPAPGLHAAVTLGVGSDPALSLAGQELTLADVLTPAEHTAIGDRAPHQAAVTLDADAGAILGLTGQQINLDVQTANFGFFGPAAGVPAVPTFRALAAADIPTHDILSKHSYTGGAALDVFGLSAVDTLARLTPSANPGAATAILKSDASGYLQLVRLGLGTAPATGLDLAVPLTSASYAAFARAVATDGTVLVAITGEAVNRFVLRASGDLEWSSGAAPYDTYLQRTNIATLEVDDNLHVATDLRVGAGLYVGSLAADPDADDIWLDGDLRAAGGCYLGGVGTAPPTGVLQTTDYVAAGGGVHVGETTDPGDDVLAIATYCLRKVLVKTGLADNAATAVFTITTTNEAGNTDGGGYYCHVRAWVGHGVASGTANDAVMAYQGGFVRAAMNTGAGVNSAVVDLINTTTLKAATSGAVRDIVSVAMTATETSEYVQTVNFTVDVSGTAATTSIVLVEVELLWYGYLTPPVIAAA